MSMSNSKGGYVIAGRVKRSYGYVIERVEDVGSSKRVHYAIPSASAEHRLYFDVSDIQAAQVYPSHHEAIQALERRASRGHAATQLGTVRIVPVTVEETSGETKREVVELSGVVDHTGLKYAIKDRGYGYFITHDGRPRLEVFDALLFSSLDSTVQYVHDYRKGRDRCSGGFSSCTSIVGIREITTAPSRVIKEVR